jgi:hypothetical protein
MYSIGVRQCHAERVADIGNFRLGDVAISFSSVTTVPLFTIAIAITNGSCPEHPRFKAMAKPRTGARVSLGIFGARDLWVMS